MWMVPKVGHGQILGIMEMLQIPVSILGMRDKMIENANIKNIDKFIEGRRKCNKVTIGLAKL